MIHRGIEKVFLFPYSKIKKGSNVIIYGAGDVGAQYARQLNLTDYGNLVAVVDRNYENIADLCGVKVSSPDEVNYTEADVVIIAVENTDVSDAISEMLARKGVTSIVKEIVRYTGAEESNHFLEYQSFTLNKKNKNPYMSVLINEKTDALRSLLNQLKIKSYEGIELKRIGGEADGGYVMDKLQSGSLAYSIGIGDEISWDAEMAKIGFDIYMYDFTVDSLPFSNERFHFKKKGITGKRSDDPAFCTLFEALQANGHMNEEHMILKMDIEGAEWEVFENEREDVLEKFDQLVFEIHNLSKPDKWEYYAKCLERLRLTHELVHVHANNVCKFLWIDGLKFADCMELTYVKKENRDFFDSNVTLPSNLDRPNICGLAEIELGDWNLNIDRILYGDEKL